MIEGKIVEEFDVRGKNGEKLRVVFRYPSRRDTKAGMRLVNRVRDEAEYLGKRHHETIKTERLFIESQIRNIRRRKGVFLFVEVNGKLAGDAIVQPLEFDASLHVGKFGIMLKEAFTGLGIGTRLMRRMLELTERETRFKVIDSGYFSRNERSKKLHKKFGFKEYGKFPREVRLRSGEYDDHIYVYKVIKPF